VELDGVKVTFFDLVEVMEEAIAEDPGTTSNVVVAGAADFACRSCFRV
jgi:hypothetical protein